MPRAWSSDWATSLAVAERRLILGALVLLRGDKDKAAQALEISVKTTHNRLREYRAGGGGEGTARRSHEKLVSFFGRARGGPGAVQRETPGSATSPSAFWTLAQ